MPERRTAETRAAIRVFISYAHSAGVEHRQRVLVLAQRLRAEGFDAWIDRFAPPPPSWPAWMDDQVEAAHFVLIACSAPWCRRFEGKEEPGEGLGVQWESRRIRAELYEGGLSNPSTKYVPVLLESGAAVHVPWHLVGAPRYALDDELDGLVRHLEERPEIQPLPLGGRYEPPEQVGPAAVRSEGAADPPPGLPVPAEHHAALEQYLDWVGAWAEALPTFPGETPRRLSSLYVELSEAELEPGASETFLGRGARMSGLSRLRIEDLVGSHPTGRWTIQGDPGAGKSTLLRHLTILRAKAARAHWTEHGTLPLAAVPILSTLPEEAAKDLSPAALAAERFAEDHPSRGGEAVRVMLEHLVRSGQALLLRDGLDEVPPDALDTCLRGLAAQVTRSEARGCGFVITSRRFGYRCPHEDFTELQLLPLEEPAQRHLLGRWLDSDDQVDGVMVQVAQAPSLADLARNPFTLTLLALLARREGAPLPRRRLGVYRAVVERLATGGSGQRPRRLDLSAEELRAGLAELALALQQRPAQSWPRDALLEAVRAVPTLARALHGHATPLVDLASDSGLLVAMDQHKRRWRFLHRTLMEYLAAEGLRARGHGDVLRLVRDLSGKPPWYLFWQPRRPEQIGRWAEVFALYAGLDDDPVEVLSRLESRHPALVKRALANVEKVPFEQLVRVLGASRDSGLELVPELVQRIDDPQARVRMLLRLARRTREVPVLQCIAGGLALLGEGEEALDEVRRRCGSVAGEDLSGVPEQVWVEVPAGSFVMGSPEAEEGRWNDEGPQVDVRFEQPFRMLAVPVTQAMYLAVTGDNPSRFEGDLRRPVESVSWNAAESFGQQISRLRGEPCRMPTEAEWEYACRAGTTTRFWSGREESDLARTGWYDRNSGGRTQPVAQKPASPWGLYDMHGNVWEWTSSAWSSSPFASGAPSDDGRVIRGGSWNGSARICRSAYRFHWHPVFRNGLLGFRLVALPPTEPGS